MGGHIEQGTAAGIGLVLPLPVRTATANAQHGEVGTTEHPGIQPLLQQLHAGMEPIDVADPQCPRRLGHHGLEPLCLMERRHQRLLAEHRLAPGEAVGHVLEMIDGGRTHVDDIDLGIGRGFGDAVEDPGAVERRQQSVPALGHWIDHTHDARLGDRTVGGCVALAQLSRPYHHDVLHYGLPLLDG